MSKLKQILAVFPEPLRDCYLNYKYKKQYQNWNLNGCNLPIPHIVKQLAIKSYQEKYNLDTLIETGTYMGDMVYAQRKQFDKIYTIELSEKLAQASRKRLRKYKNIEVIQGDSSVVLGTIVEKLKNKSFFWLDGHYSGGVTAKADKECPILQELDVILKSGFEHIILIDDAINFDGTNDYPTIEQVEIIVKKSNFPNSTIETKDNIIRIELKN